ncbi:MAG: helix-turn-helix domain-containing protein, partial [Clostridia bacterium]|nr:helix-turn-helix domain-containing protein [Clostridia bacterium]
MADEKLLIEKALSGDPIAFEDLIAIHQKNIFSIAYRIAGNQNDAEDMAQEVLIKIFKNLNQFKGNSKFST